MKRDFNLRFDDVELLGGADNFLEGSKVTSVILRGSNSLLSLNSMFKECEYLHTVDGSIDLEGISSITSLFEGCSKLVDLPVLIFRGNSVDMDRAFMNCGVLPSLKFENTTDLIFGSTVNTFQGCHNLDGVEFYGSTSKESIKMILDFFNPDEE